MPTPDLSQLSDAELEAIVAQPDISAMSDEDLRALVSSPTPDPIVGFNPNAPRDLVEDVKKIPGMVADIGEGVVNLSGSLIESAASPVTASVSEVLGLDITAPITGKSQLTPQGFSGTDQTAAEIAGAAVGSTFGRIAGTALAGPAGGGVGDKLGAVAGAEGARQLMDAFGLINDRGEGQITQDVAIDGVFELLVPGALNRLFADKRNYRKLAEGDSLDPAALGIGTRQNLTNKAVARDVTKVREDIARTNVLKGGEKYNVATGKFEGGSQPTNIIEVQERIAANLPEIMKARRDLSTEVDASWMAHNGKALESEDVAKQIRPVTWADVEQAMKSSDSPRYRANFNKVSDSTLADPKREAVNSTLKQIRNDFDSLAGRKGGGTVSYLDSKNINPRTGKPNVVKGFSIEDLNDQISAINEQRAVLGQFDAKMKVETPESLAKAQAEADTLAQMAGVLSDLRDKKIAEVMSTAKVDIGVGPNIVSRLNRDYHALSLYDKGINLFKNEANQLTQRMERNQRGGTPGILSPNRNMLETGARAMDWLTRGNVDLRKTAEVPEKALRDLIMAQELRAAPVSGFEAASDFFNQPTTGAVALKTMEEGLGKMFAADPAQAQMLGEENLRQREELNIVHQAFSAKPNVPRINDIGTPSFVEGITKGLLESEGLTRETATVQDVQRSFQMASEVVAPIQQMAQQFGTDSIEVQQALSETAKTYSAAFPKPKTGIPGEILVEGKVRLPLLPDRQVWSTRIKQDENLSEEQKAIIRSAIHRDGTVILPSSVKAEDSKNSPSPKKSKMMEDDS